MTTRRTCQILAAAAVAVMSGSAQAVIFNTTGDPTFNTTAPTGTLAGSGWQYQGNLGTVSGTPVAPQYFLSAAHIGAGVGSQFVYNNITYTTQSLQDFGDLRLYRVDKEFTSYAPLYDTTTDGLEATKRVVVIGRGTQRGAEVQVNSQSKGWLWGNEDYVRRWGENIVTGTADYSVVGDGKLLSFNFDRSGTGYSGTNEAHLSGGDSGGGVFIKVDGQWKLAGVNYSVSGPYRYEPGGPTFLGALYDTGGLYIGNPGTRITDTAADKPSTWYANRISANLLALTTAIELPPTWKVNGDGVWSSVGNWANGLPPSGAGARADFRTVISAARTVTLDGPRSVGAMYFDSAQPYTIAGPGTLSLDATGSGQAGVNVVSGSHKITAPVALVDPTTVNVMSPDAKLTISTPLNVPASLAKQGAGRLEVSRIRGAQLTVGEGTVAMIPAGTNDATSNVTSLSVAQGATLDLANNRLVTQTPVGTWNGSYNGLIGRIATARGEEDLWDGPGITSSLAGDKMAIGIARADEVLEFDGSETAVWSGQIVSTNSTLIAYTYRGDLNLDGLIDADDYSIIDTNYRNNAKGYSRGDINYDGTIDADDYSLIDTNYRRQVGDLIDDSAPRALGMTAVPEPSTAAVMALVAGALAARRRRR